MSYDYIIIPLMAIVYAQLIKFVIETVKFGRIRYTRLINGSGGMPSTHASFVTALAMCVGINMGFDSAVFGVAFVFSLVVCYDSMGVRWEAGQQANTINRLINILDLHKGLQDEMDDFKKLKEEVGHKPWEVIGGMCLGIVVAVMLI